MMSGMIDGDLRQSGSTLTGSCRSSGTGEVYYLKLTFDESGQTLKFRKCTCRDFLDRTRENLSSLFRARPRSGDLQASRRSRQKMAR